MAMNGVVMAPEVEEALVSQFLEIASDQTTTTARRYLEASNWDPEQALQLFFVGGESAYNNDYMWTDYEDPPHSFDDWGKGFSSASSDGWAETQINDGSSKINSWDKSETPAADDHHSGNDLASLFRPPVDLLFKGDFEQSKDVAKEQNRWLLVNVQSVEEFNSHRLNRDTWADETVAGIVRANFIFWQVHNDTDMGMKVCSYYRIDSFPIIMVIDPITGQKMASWAGLIQPEDLLDKLSRFMDMSPQDHILSLFKKRPQAHDEGGLETVVEEEETASEMPVYPPLPEEPKCDRSLLCRVGIRLPPDGRRIQRNFLLSDPIQLLWSFCLSELKEEERTGPFQLIQGMPGSSKFLDYDTCLTFKESGLANSILSFRFQ